MTEWWEGACAGFVLGFVFAWAGIEFNLWVKRMVTGHTAERRAELDKLLDDMSKYTGGPPDA